MILRKPLLDCIVSEMDFRLKVCNVELVGWSSDVSLLVPVGSSYSVEVGDHHVMSDVEFAVVVEEGAVYVHLHDVSSLGLLRLSAWLVLWPIYLLNEGIQLVYLIDYCDSSSLVTVLSWLYYPYIPHFRFVSPFLMFLPILVNHVLSSLVVIDELGVLWVLHALFDVESQWNVVVDIIAHKRVVLSEVIEQGFLVSEVEIVDQMVVHCVVLVLYTQYL